MQNTLKSNLVVHLRKTLFILVVISVFLSIGAAFFKRKVLIGFVQDAHYYGYDLYLIEAKNNYTNLYQVNSNNVIEFNKRLPQSKADNIYEYNELVSDDKGNIYIATLVQDINERLTAEYIEVLDPSGKHLAKPYEIIYPDGSTYTADQRRINQLSFANGHVSFFDYHEPKGVETNIASLISLDTETLEPYGKNIYFRTPVVIDEIVYSGSQIYYKDMFSRLFVIYDDGSQKQINLPEGEKILPYKLSVSADGTLYFTDVRNIKFYSYDVFEDKVIKLFDSQDRLAENSELRFDQVFNAEYQYEALVCLAPQYSNNGLYILKGSDLSHISHVYKNIQESLIDAVIVFASAVFAILIGLLIFLGVIRKKMLIRNMIISLLPFIIVSGVLYAFYLSNVIDSTLYSEILAQLYIISNNAAAQIDGDELENIILPINKFDEYYKKINALFNLDTSILIDSDKNHIPKSLYYTLYKIEDREPYVALGGGMVSHMKIRYFSSQDNIDYIYYKNTAYNDILKREIEDSTGDWMFSVRYIRNSRGKVVGFLETGVNKDVVSVKVNEILVKNMAFVGGITLLIISGMVFSIKNSLKGLKKLENGASQLAKGDWFAKVDIKSNDELMSVGNAFNMMSSYIEQYLDTTLKLSHAYEKFVPKSFFTLIGSKDVLDADINKLTTKDLYVMSINIKNFYHLIDAMTKEENFKFISELFSLSADTIKVRNGIIENFNGKSSKVLYTHIDDAIKSALEINEKINSYNSECNIDADIGITLQYGRMLAGVIGNESRVTVTTVSDEVNMTDYLDKLSDSLGTKILITKEAFDKIDCNQLYGSRYIGVFEPDNFKKTELFDIIDGYPYPEKERRLSTEREFTSGIDLYMNGQYSEARNRFIDVIRTDHTDNIAKYYLFLCEGHLTAK